MKTSIFKKKNPNSRSARISRVLFNRMFPKRLDALKVAFSVSIGVFIGIIPTIGVAILLTCQPHWCSLYQPQLLFYRCKLCWWL